MSQAGRQQEPSLVLPDETSSALEEMAQWLRVEPAELLSQIVSSGLEQLSKTL